MAGSGDARGRRRRWLTGITAVLVTVVVAAACGSSDQATDPGSGRPEPVGSAIDLSTPGFHSLTAPPSEGQALYGGRVVAPMGDELAIWGGVSADGASSPGRLRNDGALLSLSDGRWTVMPSSPFPEGLYDAVGAWDGEELIIIGTECEGDVPPDTDGSPPSCPKGPAAAAFDPEAFSWRRLTAPPIPLHQFHEALVLGRRVGVAGDGQALFTFGPQGVSITWDSAEESWGLVDEPFGGTDWIRYCADPVAGQVVAAARTQPPMETRVLAVGGSGWGAPVTAPEGIESILTCGDGLVAISGLAGQGSAMRSEGWVIDVVTAATEPAFEPSPDLRYSWIVGPWLFTETSMRLADGDGATELHPVAVRAARGGETIEVEAADQFSAGIYLPGVGVLFGDTYRADEDLTIWRPPPELWP